MSFWCLAFCWTERGRDRPTDQLQNVDELDALDFSRTQGPRWRPPSPRKMTLHWPIRNDPAKCGREWRGSEGGPSACRGRAAQAAWGSAAARAGRHEDATRTCFDQRGSAPFSSVHFFFAAKVMEARLHSSSLRLWVVDNEGLHPCGGRGGVVDAGIRSAIRTAPRSESRAHPRSVASKTSEFFFLFFHGDRPPIFRRHGTLVRTALHEEGGRG